MNDDFSRKVDSDRAKDFKLSNKYLSPLMESPNQVPFLFASYIMSNQNSLGQNEGFLHSSTSNQSPFFSILFNKNPSLIVPKVLNPRKSSMVEPIIRAPRESSEHNFKIKENLSSKSNK
mmetsp:Transcript_7615/g.8601  ORF Transcript_7615/g.8601 Transcript_7615/m.8601 type:complete len:119 (-) Transcript_7615:196-552(-)